MDELDRSLERLRQEYRDRTLLDRTYALLDFHLGWAEATKSTQPELAVRQYLLAEAQQSTIGTFATGSGEGLASMSSLYGIRGKRADLLERLADAASDRAVSHRFLREALAVWSEIDADPNGLGEDTPAASKIRRLKSRLGNREP